MASLCKRQQCTIDRRGFRQELDSWRHKLLHCVGFESILEGLFDPELAEDLKLFKDFEPVAVSDWSFDENCLFCCLRRDKVKEHLIGLNSEGVVDVPKPLLVKDQITISRLEKQAEEFLNAVLCRKDVPNFSDPHIPVVAREILQRMIRQFAVEYTSKTSSPQDSFSDSQPNSDQSLSTPPLLSGAPPPISPPGTLSGPTHNPVLSKLLMADQDAPLDLTIKKPLAEPTEQDGVLDLSIKKNRYCNTLPVHSPTSTIKGESHDIGVTKASDLQSTSSLVQFMAKLCPHHQRQIVDAIGYLQTEVKAQASCNTQKSCNAMSGTQRAAKSSLVTPEPRFPSEFTPKSEVQEMSHSNEINVKHAPESAVSLKTFVAIDPVLGLRGHVTGSNLTSSAPAASPVDTENNRQGDHAPLKMKIMTSNAAAGKRLSCVLNASLSSKSDTLEDRRGNSNSSSRTEPHSARLSSTLKRHTIHTRQREVLGHAKDMAAQVFPIHMTLSSDSTRTARKTIRSSTDQPTKDTTCRAVIDPDLGHCDIVFIDKPITECFKKRHRSMTPRRNARKSTRGHMYSDEIWELKTVRTLAGRGNCPNPMSELITLVTPKQIFSRPEGVPPLDMPFVGACSETIQQEITMEQSVESVTPVTQDIVEVAASQLDVIVKTSQIDQCQSRPPSSPPTPSKSTTANVETIMNVNVAQEKTADSDTTMQNEESLNQTPVETEMVTESQPHEETHDSTEQVVAQTGVEALENESIDEAEPLPPLDEPHNGESVLQQTTSSPVRQIEEGEEHHRMEKLQDAQPQECQPDTHVHGDNTELTEEVNTACSNENVIGEESENESSKVDECAEAKEDNGDDYDLSSKTLNALLKELPPWRRKKGTQVLLPKHMRQTKTTIVGYVNGRPISASDRNLRRRTSNVTSSKTPVKSSGANEVRDSVTKSSPSEKTISASHTQSKSVEAAPTIDKLTESSTNTRSSPTSKSPVKTKQTQKQKQLQRAQDSLPVLSDHPDESSSRAGSKRELRSTKQKSSTTPLPPKAITPIAIPDATATSSISLIEPVLAPSPHAASITTSPLVKLTNPSEPELSSQNSVPETVEENTENTQQAQLTDDEKKNQFESGLEAKQKLRSAKSIDCNSKSEKWQNCEISSPSSESPVKAEMPLRSKRILRREPETNDVALLLSPNVESSEDTGASSDDNSSSISDKPTKMPLRSESNKAEKHHQSLTQSPNAKHKKSALKSQRLASPSPSNSPVAEEQNDVGSPLRIMPARGSKSQVKSLSAASVSHSSHNHIISPKHNAPKPTPNKFYQTMTGEKSQQLINNLNIRYDKMQKGWVQMDKDGQPATKYRNKADRQAAIWKSKRRARKPKSSEHQKYSPVQMLFMKSFNLTSICRWFLESTETKSLVIVKKVNTRLPSETQLCFHSSSSASGTSQGVFPSLQAERLKKHLKKFAIASPVKSNPKSQKLIAKVLEQDANAVKGKERGELPSTTQTLNKSYSSAKASAQVNEPKKSSGKPKNPASARILRKYSNIREKMQVQQTTVRLKEASKISKAKSIKTLDTPKSPKKSNMKPSLKAPNSPQTRETAAKMEKRQTLAGKKSSKLTAQEKSVRAVVSNKTSKYMTRKVLPKRSSQRLGCRKISGNVPTEPSKTKVDKKHTEAEKPEVEKNATSRINSAKMQTKESPQILVAEFKGAEKSAEALKQSSDVNVLTSPDQVLTRSQRKMEVAAPVSESPSKALKRQTKSITTQNATSKSVKKADEPTQTRRNALKPAAKRSQAISLPRSASKLATKRAQELLETPAKRTRTSLSR